MFRNLTALAAALALGGIAHAERVKTIEVELVYEPALLATEEGASAVLSSLTRQATYACRTLSMASKGFSVDEICVQDMVDEAVEKIGADTLHLAHLTVEADS